MKIDVKHVAKLANLPLTEEETEKFGDQLSSILDYVEQLKKVDTTGVEETSQVTGLENILRTDKTGPSLSQEEALQNTEPTRNASQSDAGGATYNGHFKVKAILEE